MDPELAKQIPKSRTDQFELLFSGSQSLYQFLPSATNDGDGNTFQSGNNFIRLAGPGNEISYHDLEKALRTDRREVMERGFIVTDSIRKLEWKLSDETKTIDKYTARKATAKRIETRYRMSMENGQMKREPYSDTSLVVAWFTTDIPVSVGPDFQGQLPGAILEMDIANGQVVYKAVEISPDVNKGKIKAPKDGKKVTAAEYITERDKLMEEMRANMGPNRSIRIQQ